MFYPQFDRVRELAKSFNVIPISMEIPADMETPISLFKRFEEREYCFLLESVEGGENWARYSIFGREPYLIVKSYSGKTTIDWIGGEQKEAGPNPIEIIREIMESYKGANLPGLPRFNGGAVGYLGYDTIRYYENLPNMPEDDLGFPESCFMFSNEIFVYDHVKHKIHIIVNMHVKDNLERDYNSAVDRIKKIHQELVDTKWKITDTGPFGREKIGEKVDFSSNMTKESFCKNVLRAKEYIKKGDVSQVVLSQRLCVKTDEKPFNIYRGLRTVNPSPYMFYLKFDDFEVVGSSPEMLVRVENGVVQTCPIAGTRKRGSTQEEDRDLERELLSDKKEIAEHRMLVKLGETDLGKVSKPGSIRIEKPMNVEKYSHVMHIVTNIKGDMREDMTAFDALAAVLPAGTLSGVPRLRAMEIIDELETVKRGPYGGAIGYFSFNGNLDSCITIRTMILKGGKVYIQAGAGIVAQSVPETEYEECINKSKALLKALEEAGGVG